MLAILAPVFYPFVQKSTIELIFIALSIPACCRENVKLRLAFCKWDVKLT